MFDVGWTKLLLIAVVALIVVGPKELPTVLRAVGHWMGKIRRMAAEFQSQFQEAMREAEMEDLKKHADDLNDSVRSLTKPFDSAEHPRKLDTLNDTPANLPASVAEPSPKAIPTVGADLDEAAAGPRIAGG
jgi:sec-independent protein translocase protein TatB